MIREVYLHLMGDHGVMMRLERIECALTGTMNGKAGLLFRFNDHVEDHKRAARRISLLAGVVGSMSGFLVWLADRLGFL